MTGFSCIECIGGKDVSKVKPVFSANSELIFVANGNKVDIHSSHSGDFIHSLNSEVSISEQIVALFLNPINTKLLVAVFENGFVVTWAADSGNIEHSSRLQLRDRDTLMRIANARCHANVIDTSQLDIFAIVEITTDNNVLHKMKVFAYKTGEEKIIKHQTFKSLVFQDVGSLNVIHFGGAEEITSNGKTMSGRFLCVITGPKMFVIFLRCIFEPWYEQENAIHNRQEIRMKTCWYQMGEGRSYSSVTCHPTDYNVAVGDTTGRVVVYTGVFLHAQYTKHVHDSANDRKRHLSEDKLSEELSDSEEEEGTSRRRQDTPVVAKRSTVSRHMTWAITTVYHWHSFPVMDVLYSETGNFILSGGGERVLAEWTLPHCRKPRTLPRLPGTIVNITRAPSGQMIVSTRDNSLHIVDQTSFMVQKVATSIQRLVRDEYRLNSPVHRSFLIYDRRTSSLVLNSRKGHIQYFSLTSNSLLFNLDITEENIVSELHHDACNTTLYRQGTRVSHSDVLSAAVSQDGLCLATIECLADNYVLKFWNYSAEIKTFKLRSVISKPHQGRAVNYLRFSPTRAEFNDPHTYTCVTSGGDDQYSVWTCTHRDETVSWSKYKQDQYHGLQAGPVGFSQDGSSLAVGFGPCLTLWDRNFDFKCSLSHACDKSDTHFIRFLEWGQGAECCHLLVGACSGWVRVWNTILGHNIWQVPLSAVLLVSDPVSSYMALFTNTHNIYVFKPSSTKPEAVYSTKGQNTPIAACFVSCAVDETDATKEKPWCETSQLYFVTEQLELMLVKVLRTFDEQPSPLRVPYKPVMMKTPFSSMIAEEVIDPAREKSNRQDEQTYENCANVGDIAKFLTYTPLSMAPLELLCAQLLRSTLKKKTKANVIKKQNETSDELELMNTHSFDDVSYSTSRGVACLSTMDDSCVMWIKNLV